MIDFTDFKCPFLTKDDIDQRADEYHADYWEKDELPVDVELIIEKRGITIVPDLLTESIDAYLTNDGTSIIVNSKTYNDERFIKRVRFSLAHELGHFVLHRPIIEQMSFDNIEEYYNFISNFPKKEYEFFEYQAHEFAGRLLVPVDKLKTEINKLAVKIREENLVDILKKEPDQVLSYSASDLCRPFDVSEQVIKRRVVKEKLWPPKINKMS